jgi:hypothetical protein
VFLFISFYFLFASINLNKTMSKNALEILYTSEDWNSNTVSFNFFIKNENFLKFNKDAHTKIVFTYYYLKNKLNKLSVEQGFNYKTTSSVEFNSFLISVNKKRFLENYRKIIDVFLKSELDKEIFLEVKEYLSNYNKTRTYEDILNSCISSHVFTSKSFVYKFNNLDPNKIEKIDIKIFSDFFNLYLSPNNLIISISNFNNVDFVKQYIEKYKIKLALFDKSNNYANLEYAIPKRIFKNHGTGKNTNLKVGFYAPRCAIKDSYYYELLNLIDLNNATKNYSCFSNFGFFELNYFNIDYSSDEIIKKLRKSLKFFSENISNDEFIFLKNMLKKKYDLIYYDKVKFMFLIGKSYFSTSSLNPFLFFKEPIENLSIVEFKKLLNKVSEKKYYELIIRG